MSIRVARDEGAGLAARPEVLARVEAEGRHVPDAADAPALVLGAVRLARVLDDEQIVFVRDGEDGVEVRRLAVEVDGHDGPGARGDRALDEPRIHRVARGIDVHEHGLGARVADGGHRRHERVGDGDHLVPGADAAGEEREVQRARAGVHPGGEPGAHVGRELLLERDHLVAEGELATVEDARRGLEKVGLERAVLGFQIQERNHRLPPSYKPTGLPRSFSDRTAASSTSTTRRPSSPSVIGRLLSSMLSAKCVAAAESASTLRSSGAT